MDGGTPEQLLIAILANAITSLGEAAVRARRGPGSPALEAAARKASARLCDVEEIREELGGERLRAFLSSAEMSQFARQAFAIRVDARSGDTSTDSFTLADVEDNFVRSLQAWTGIGEEVARLHGPRLFGGFLDACDEALDLLVRGGSSDAADARARFNSKRILEELTNLRRLVELCGREPGVDLDAIARFAASYRRQVVEDHAVIALPSLEAHHLRRVDEVYVKPTLVPGPGGEPLAYDELFPLAGNTVILGDPGGGKSTMISRMVVDVADEGDLCTPVVVVLRDYAAEKARSSCSIVDFMGIRATSRYQISRSEVPPGAFEYLLRSQRTVVFLDGLDELMQVADRRALVGDIEAFRRLYPTVTTVVTSRRIGYEEAPLQPDLDRCLTLASLDLDQVEEYARLVLLSHPSVRSEDAGSLRAGFMDKSGALGDLRGNPLLLGLLLERYVKTRDLPSHKVEVVESCALMLFERWDTDRDIPVRFPFESKLRPAVASIASDIYGSPELEEGVTEAWLIDRAKAYLLGRRYEDADEAAAEAREFVGLCRGRTWVFSAVGATAVEELYRFTHRTFMEYFVAVHVVRGSETTAELVEAIQARVERQEWDEVCQTAVYLGTEREGGPDALLDLLAPLQEALDEPAGRNRLTFCTRSLALVVPDRLASVHRFLDAWMGALLEPEARTAVPELLSTLVNSHPENQLTVSRALPERFLAQVSGRPRPESMVWLLEVGLSLTRFLSDNAEAASRGLWRDTERRVAAGAAELIRDLAGSRAGIARLALIHDVLDIDGYLEVQAPGALFADPCLALDGGAEGNRIPVGSVAENILGAVTVGDPRETLREEPLEWGRRHLWDLGRWVEGKLPERGRLPRPWTVPGDYRGPKPSVLSWLEGRRPIPIGDWTGEEIFGAAFLALGLAEHRGANRAAAGAEEEAGGAPVLRDLLRPFLLGRDDPGRFQGADQARELLSERQFAILARWGGRDFSFTR